MKILKSNRTGNVVSLELEIPQSVIQTQMDVAFLKMVKSAKVPGYRQGKIPRNVFEKYYGPELLIKEGVIEAVNQCYAQAVKEQNLVTVDFPKNIQIPEYKADQNLIVTMDVDVSPEVKLGKYKGLKATKTLDVVDDTKVDQYIDQLRERYARYDAQNEKAVQEHDAVRCDIEAQLNGETLKSLTHQNQAIIIGGGTFGKDFDTAIVGMKVSESKSFTVTFDPEFRMADVAGKTVDFTVKIVDIRIKVLPELTDEFVQKLAPNKTAAEFKTQIKEQLEAQAKKTCDDNLKQSLIEQVTDASEVEVQQVLIEREIDRSLQQFEQQLQRSGLNLARYKELIKKEDAAIRADFAEGAAKRVKQDLVLDAIAEKEQIKAEETDLIAEIKGWKAPDLTTDEEIKAFIQKETSDGFVYFVKQKKTIDFLIANAKIKE